MRTITAGPRLRCFLGFVAPALALIASAPVVAQDRCVVPHGVAVPQIRGQVFDAFGIAVPFATVTVLGIHGAVQTTADDLGQFSFEVPAGHYVFKAEAEGFSYSSAELKVGRTWQTMVGHQTLKVMLGFGDTYCPWVTTSKQNFESTADSNMTRLKQSAQIMDTSQADDAPPTKGTPPGKKTSHKKKKTKTKKTSQTKDTSQTNATQK
ncbi:MAG TPA: carboxypeptidase-like regulatory domain-containing protein [Terracidiphilus sp.]|nr:carboxypeptidase-like regulatory domain-containing protein [Terracidiphilus sp.]